MATLGTEVGDFSFGRIFSRATAAIGSNPGTFFGISFVFGALPSLLVSYAQVVIGQPTAEPTPERILSTIGSGLVAGVIGLILAMLVQGGLVRATMAHEEGRVAGFGESAKAGLAVALPLVGLALLSAVAILIGFMLFVIPGVILYIMWSVAAPVLVEEKRGVIESLGRSRALTKGVRWRIFGLQLVILVGYWILAAIVGVILFATMGVAGMAAMATASTVPISWLVLTALLSTIVTTLWSTLSVSLYIELRNWKEGTTSSRLADIFA